jgi:hypothetical protein
MSAEQARAEAERRFTGRGGTMWDLPEYQRVAFEAGAEWQASREVTEAEVEAAALALYQSDWPHPKPELYDDWEGELFRRRARAALVAAREVRS